jgi:hypothetical protein
VDAAYLLVFSVIFFAALGILFLEVAAIGYDKYWGGIQAISGKQEMAIYQPTYQLSCD